MYTQPTQQFATVRRLSAAALLAGLAAGAIAQTTPAAPAPAPAAQAASTVPGPQLNIRQVYDRLEAAGYRDLREVEWSDGRYEVKARNAQGERVKLDVDGSTGAVLRSRVKD